MQAKRKLTALLLSLCMLLGMLPMTVFAAGETTAEGLVYEVNGESVTIGVLITGAIIFVLLTAISLHWSIKNFEKIDL